MYIVLQTIERPLPPPHNPPVHPGSVIHLRVEFRAKHLRSSPNHVSSSDVQEATRFYTELFRQFSTANGIPLPTLLSLRAANQYEQAIYCVWDGLNTANGV